MIHSILDYFHKLTDPDQLSILIDTALSGWWVYIIMIAIIFCENAILLGFILPGDSLLFTLGVVAANGKINIWALMGVLFIAAVLGDSTGYYLGKKTGPAIFRKKDSFLFKQEYVHRTQLFFEKYGGKTVLIGRFVPVIRSFTPFMAGVGSMPYHTFLTFNVLGSFIWVVVISMLGYLLGNVPIIKDNFEIAILLVIVISFIPAVIEFFLQRRRAK